MAETGCPGLRYAARVITFLASVSTTMTAVPMTASTVAMAPSNGIWNPALCSATRRGQNKGEWAEAGSKGQPLQGKPQRQGTGMGIGQAFL